MHCYFVLAGDSTIPVLYHVERVRGGKSFITRTVQARQKGKCIFTTTISFVREGSAGEEVVGHEVGLPEGVEDALRLDEGSEGDVEAGGGPFEARRLETLNLRMCIFLVYDGRDADTSIGGSPHAKRTRQWVRCRGNLSPDAGTQGHLSALAYMTDSYFIGTIARVHNLWRFGRPSSRPSTSVSNAPLPSAANKETTLDGEEPPAPARTHIKAPAPSNAHREMAEIEQKENDANKGEDETRVIGMMVSLDHSIYFHNPRAIRADEWLFAEMDSPWAGDGRGLVFQRIWNRGGELVATCIQEGVVRLVQGREKVKL